MKEDIIQGYKLGADDYITKPFDSEVLLLKIKAILKRNEELNKESENKEFDLASYHFNPKLRQLSHKGMTQTLSPKENELLKMLAEHLNDLVWMRRDAPVYWSPRDEVWAITKYEDIRWISKSPELFSNRYHIYVAGKQVHDTGAEIDGDTGPPRDAELRRVAAMGPMQTDNLVMADGARHRFLRKIAGHAFTPKAINDLEAQVQQIASDLFDAIPEGEEVDFVDTVAAPLR